MVLSDDICIKVIGVGGGGCNAIETMAANNLAGVEFIAANTDMQVLTLSKAAKKIQLGPNVTKGMGSGGDPERGKAAAEESYNDLVALLEGAHMVFITAGMGGGTGTGAAPIVAKACKEVGALTVAVVSKPFNFEGKKRMRNAEAGWQALREHADTIITVPNDRLLTVMDKSSPMRDMMVLVDQVLLQAVRGITDLIKLPGQINVDFEDLKTVMREVGPAIMGTGTAVGENRAVQAAKAAIDNQLLEDVGIDGAKAVLVNISASEDTLTLSEYQEAATLIQEKAHDDATIILGALYDEALGDEMRITVIATGISSKEEEQVLPPNRLGGTTRSAISSLHTRRTSFDSLDSRPFVKDHPSSGVEVQAQPNKPPVGLTSMPTPLFDELDLEDLEEPAFIRKQAN